MESENRDVMKDISSVDELLYRAYKYKGSDEFFKFFDFISKFNYYSRFNSMMVYIQNPNVEFFGSKTYWKTYHNRCIKRDARPYIILVPMGPIMMAYDIFDTEGELSPEEYLKKGLGRKPFEVEGNLTDDLFKEVVKEAKRWGIDVVFKPLSYFKGGHITTIISGKLEICLKENAKEEENFSTIVHELAHLFLGHTGHEVINYSASKKNQNIKQRKIGRSVEELEAESVSYLICHGLGLITSSAKYIAGYIKNEEDLVNFSYENVIKVTDKIDSLFIKKSKSKISLRKDAELKRNKEKERLNNKKYIQGKLF